jgi:3-oxoacyl-[acyl-carrier-protein] synthase II
MERSVVGVTGVGMICAAGRDSEQVWERLLSGRSAVAPLQGEEFACFDGAIGGQVPDEWVDGRQGPRRADALALAAVSEAVADSGHPLRSVAPDRVALVVARCQGPPLRRGVEHETMSALCDRLAEELGITGPRILVSTACAAGGNAVGIARDRLWAGDVDLVIAGGVDDLQRGTYAGFSALQALDSRPCAPYSRSGGLNLGEGAAFLVVEREEDARARGARIRAEVLGYGLSGDAHHATAPDPTGRGATMAVRRALADADVAVSDIGWVNGHGTGTPANDAAERKVMRNLFGEASPKVPITSVKSFIGHTLGASGAIEAAVSVLAIERGVIPPTANVEAAPGPQDLDCVPLVPRRQLVPLVVSNNYAFGGNNVSLIMGRPGRGSPQPPLPSPGVTITGIGLLTERAAGVPEWLALSEEHAEEWRLRQVSGEDLTSGLKPYARPGTWRHLNAFTKASLAVTREALEDAALTLTREQRDHVALLLGTASGAAASVKYGEAVGDDPRKSSVHAFAHLTLNAPAGAVCQALGLRGPTTTLVSGGTSGTLAIESAVDLIVLGKAQTVVVVAADEIIPGVQDQLGTPESEMGLCRPFDRSRSGATLSSAAVALVLESTEHAVERGATRYADISAVLHGSGSTSPGYDLAGRYADILRVVLGRAEVPPDELGLVVASAGGVPRDEIEEAALVRAGLQRALVTAPKSLVGECQAASGTLNVAVGALALSSGIVPPTRNLMEPGSDELRHVRQPLRADLGHAVALSADLGTALGAVVLRACD